MECLQCSKVLCYDNALMTYQKSIKEIHLIIKPELDRSKLTNLILVSEGKDTRVACKNCGQVAGKEVPVGPIRAEFYPSVPTRYQSKSPTLFLNE